MRLRPGNASSTTPWVSGGAPAKTGNTNDEVPPLCAMQSTDGSIASSVSDYTVQVYAKAYPTIRELMLANMMGSRGSCPRSARSTPIDNASGDDPLYGYRPAVDVLVNRMAPALQPAL